MLCCLPVQSQKLEVPCTVYLLIYDTFNSMFTIVLSVTVVCSFKDPRILENGMHSML